MEQKEIIKTVEEKMIEGGKASTAFLRGAFSDGGVPSSSRILTTLLGLLVTIVIVCILHHICYLKDNVALGLWLGNLPMIITALVGLMAAPYGINRGSASITDILSSMRK